MQGGWNSRPHGPRGLSPVLSLLWSLPPSLRNLLRSRTALPCFGPLLCRAFHSIATAQNMPFMEEELECSHPLQVAKSYVGRNGGLGFTGRSRAGVGTVPTEEQPWAFVAAGHRGSQMAPFFSLSEGPGAALQTSYGCTGIQLCILWGLPLAPAYFSELKGGQG